MSRGALLLGACSLGCGASRGSDANQLVQASAVTPVVCELPHAECDGDSYTACETNLELSRAHCGSCGRACGDGLVCFEGECGPGAAQIHTGTFATCAVMVSGAVRCWGRVGDASFEDWQGAAEVRVGNRIVCARFEDHVRCRALEGSADGEVRLPLPGKVAALRVQAPFMDRVLVVGDGGELYLLGYETDIVSETSKEPYLAGPPEPVRQLEGDYVLGQSGQVYEPTHGLRGFTPVQGADDIVALSTGGQRAAAPAACGIVKAGGVKCWKAKDRFHDALHGKGIEDGVVDPVSGPAESFAVLGLDGIVDLAVAELSDGIFACGTRVDGSAACWMVDPSGKFVVARELSGVGEAQTVRIGRTHGCVLTKVGEAYCWGSNSLGQLGHEAPPFLALPVDIGLTGVTAVAAGDRTWAARLSDGSWWQWGGSDKTDAVLASPEIETSPVRVNDLPPDTTSVLFAPLRCAKNQSEAPRCSREGQWAPLSHDFSNGPEPARRIVGASAQMLCLGSKSGSSHCGFYDAERGAIHPAWEVPLDDASGLSVSDDAACAVSAGRAKCFAWRDWSLLSDFGAQSGKAFDLGLEGVRQLVLGSRYLCALHGGGQVRCWGTVGVFPTRDDPSKKLVAPKLQGVEELAGGARHVCARRDGRATCWGMNTYGELGHGEAGDDMGPGEVTGLEDATRLVADFGTTCALRASGQVACWGMGHHGELGTLVGASRELLRAPLAP